MEQLDLFPDDTLPVRYLTPEELVSRGYCISMSDALNITIPVDINGNVTKHRPNFKTSVQQQWEITFMSDNKLIGSEDC